MLTSLLFGSAACREERTDSDVDVLLVGTVGFAEVVKALHTAQGCGGDGFLFELLAKDKLFLLGDEDELGERAGDQAAAPASGLSSQHPQAVGRDGTLIECIARAESLIQRIGRAGLGR